MLLPPDMLKKLYYYHHTSSSSYGDVYDVVTIVYQGWFLKRKKKFKFRRITSYNSGDDIQTYTMVVGCEELLKQLNKKMREKNDTPEIPAR